VTTEARSAVLDRFQWVDGHADVWRVFADGAALAAVIESRAGPWREAGVTHVLGVESRGFLLGAATAVALDVGFVGIRKGSDGLLPGPKVTTTGPEDYRGRRHHLRMQAVIGSQDRVLLVDDWAERGSQARAAKALALACGAEFLGMSVVVDMLDAESRAELARVTAIVTADDLGPSS
jgi:adenine phosphoribosyltransferase